MTLMSGGQKMRFGHIKGEQTSWRILRLLFGFTYLSVQKAVQHHHHETLKVETSRLKFRAVESFFWKIRKHSKYLCMSDDGSILPNFWLRREAPCVYLWEIFPGDNFQS